MGKSGAKCTICSSKFRHQIEIGLTHLVPANALGLRFKVSSDAILRHAKNHLTAAMRAAILTAQVPSAVDLDALKISESEGLLSALVVQRARLQAHGELAASLGDVRGCVAVEGAITSNLTLVARLLQQLIQVHDVRHTSILVSPDYLKLRAALVKALAPFPEAARAVGAALHAIEAEGALDITARAKAPALIEHLPVEHANLSVDSKPVLERAPAPAVTPTPPPFPPPYPPY